MHHHHNTTARDMTEGGILRHLIAFSLPLLLGNIFQMLYNTVDSIVVGKFVGKEALAAVGSTTMIVNIMIFFFNGVAIGAGVVIGNYFGAKKLDLLHKAVETTMAVTFLFGVGVGVGVGAGLLHSPRTSSQLVNVAEAVRPKAAKNKTCLMFIIDYF